MAIEKLVTKKNVTIRLIHLSSNNIILYTLSSIQYRIVEFILLHYLDMALSSLASRLHWEIEILPQTKNRKGVPKTRKRNAKRLKRETPLRNGPKILDCFAGPTAGGHPKVRNLCETINFGFKFILNQFFPNF